MGDRIATAYHIISDVFVTCWLKGRHSGLLSILCGAGVEQNAGDVDNA